MVIDKWIDGLLDDLKDSADAGWPEVGALPALVEDINFHMLFQPYPLTTANVRDI